MGYCYSELIPPAILFDHPKVTANQYTRLIDNVAYSSVYWQSKDIYRLPELLGLPHTRQFNSFNNLTETDSNGFEIDSLCCLSYENGVKIHLRNEISTPIQRKELTSPDLKPGDIIPNIRPGSGLEIDFLVEEVVSRQLPIDKKSLPEEIEYYSKIDTKTKKVKVKGRKITHIYKYEYFDAIYDLYKKYPQFKPENVYDFSVTEGRFPESNISIERFGWRMTNGRYYFDETSLDRIPAGGWPLRERKVGYTDLILTAEVIKKKRQDYIVLLGENLKDEFYRERDEDITNFLKRFPSSRKRSHLAIWDSHTSIDAKNRGLTNLEFMRRRLEFKLN
jgi:hypothetical protein